MVYAGSGRVWPRPCYWRFLPGLKAREWQHVSPSSVTARPAIDAVENFPEKAQEDSKIACRKKTNSIEAVTAPLRRSDGNIVAYLAGGIPHLLLLQIESVPHKGAPSARRGRLVALNSRPGMPRGPKFARWPRMFCDSVDCRAKDPEERVKSCAKFRALRTPPRQKKREQAGESEHTWKSRGKKGRAAREACHPRTHKAG